MAKDNELIDQEEIERLLQQSQPGARTEPKANNTNRRVEFELVVSRSGHLRPDGLQGVCQCDFRMHHVEHLLDPQQYEQRYPRCATIGEQPIRRAH